MQLCVAWVEQLSAAVLHFCKMETPVMTQDSLLLLLLLLLLQSVDQHALLRRPGAAGGR
jgi:hypothetical protein